MSSEIFEKPFISRWIFDVEIVARYSRLKIQVGNSSAFTEVPLRNWIDRADSKIQLEHFQQAPIDLFRIWKDYK